MIILALGSNLDSIFGDRFKNINIAISLLENYKIKLIKKSSFYETPSYPDKSDPKFINNVIQIETNLKVLDLLSVLIFIEKKIGRVRNKKNDPRTCDIDIIDYNGEVLNSYYDGIDFTIPHKSLKIRNFVLYPLQEILPNWKHPKTGEDINHLISNLSEEDKLSILKIRKS